MSRLGRVHFAHGLRCVVARFPLDVQRWEDCSGIIQLVPRFKVSTTYGYVGKGDADFVIALQTKERFGNARVLATSIALPLLRKLSDGLVPQMSTDGAETDEPLLCQNDSHLGELDLLIRPHLSEPICCPISTDDLSLLKRTHFRVRA